MQRIVFIVFICFLQQLYSQAHLNYTLAVYPQNERSRNVARMLKSSENWTKIGVLNTLLWQRQKRGYWRVGVVFHGLKTNKEVTLQLGLRTPDNCFISFKFPKKLQSDPRKQEFFSNWFEQKEKKLSKDLLQEPTQAYVRLLGDSQTEAILNIKTLTLERWQENGSSPPLRKMDKLDETREEAKYIAIDFFDFLLEERMLRFSRAVPIYNLNTGALINFKGWHSLMLGEYAARSEYRYRFYDYQQMYHSFPDLFKAEREWKPSSQSFLFLAYTPHRKEVVRFIIEKKNESWELVGLSSVNPAEEELPKLRKSDHTAASHVSQNFLAYHPQSSNSE